MPGRRDYILKRKKQAKGRARGKKGKKDRRRRKKVGRRGPDRRDSILKRINEQKQ